jgi:hypothetical protein
MKIRSKLANIVNQSLGAVGVHLVKCEYDLISSGFTDSCQSIVTAKVQERIDSLLSDLKSIGINDRFNTPGRLADFHRDYLVSAVKNHGGGIQYNNAIVLFSIASALSPSLIIDSGTFRGFSAWVLRRACPGARISSFDVSLQNLRIREPSVNYVQSDWFSGGPDAEDWKNSLCFFDDHVDQVKRIEEAATRGVRWAIFDDDTSVGATHQGHNSRSFPKVSFLYSDLESVEKLSWQNRGRQHDLIIDHARLASARLLVESYVRLPEISSITGCSYQLPLTLVKLRGR